MSKFNLFVIIFSFTLLITVTDILTNSYLRSPQARQEISANIYQNEQTPPKNQTPLAPPIQIPETPVVPISQSPDGPITVSSTDEEILSFSLLLSIGFNNVVLARVPFQGFLFESIDLRDIKNVEVVSHNILENNRKRLATIYEFRTQNPSLATELYGLIQQKSLLLPNVSLNETNAFGDASFYINYSERTTFTFLVVKQGGNVYALTYRKELHPLIKKLINLLPAS